MDSVDRIGFLPIALVSQSAAPSMAIELADTFQGLDDTLTAFAGLSWTAGKQIPALTGVDTLTLFSVGAANATDMLDRAAGDARYVQLVRAINTTAPLTGGGDLSADRTLGISAATTGAAGSMSAADKAKLDGITGTNTGDQTITLTGDVTGSGTGSFAATLATVNSNVGSFGSATQVATFTVNGKGQVTAAGNVTITPAASAITGGAALTKTDDTNVTLTLGGSASTALLAAVSLAAGWTGVLSIARGGHGGATTGSGNFARASSPLMADISLQQTLPTLYFRNSGGTRLGYFQHDGSNLNIITDVGNLVVSTVQPAADNTYDLGTAAKRMRVIYAGTGTINTSDARAKREVEPIPNEWLDAWGEVQWCRFRFVDGTRWHVGLIAQEVYAAFKRYGIDAFEIGLLCFDKWKAVRARKERLNAAGEVVRPARAAVPAGDRWGLRYDECQAMEAAWQRREMATLRALVAA